MNHPTQQSTTYEEAPEQQEYLYYENVPVPQTQPAQTRPAQVQPAQAAYPTQPIKQKNFWFSVIWAIVQMVIVGVLTYALVNFIFGMSMWNSLKTDTVAPGPDSAVGSVQVPNPAAPGVGAETVPVLDIPDEVMAGQRFGYTIARSTYGAEGVSAVYIDFGDGTRMEYVSGNAPNEGQYAYADAGRYIATLTIVDADGAEYTDTRTVLVGDPDQRGAQEPETVLV